MCFTSDDFSDEQVSARIRELADQQTRLTSLDVVRHLKISLTLAQEFLLVRCGGKGGMRGGWDVFGDGNCTFTFALPCLHVGS